MAVSIETMLETLEELPPIEKINFGEPIQEEEIKSNDEPVPRRPCTSWDCGCPRSRPDFPVNPRSTPRKM